MLLAVPTHHERIAPAFDFCHKVGFWRLDGRGVKKVAERNCSPAGADEKAARLQAMGTEVLLCGAISTSLEQNLAARGIKVHSGLAGEVVEVVAAFASGALNHPRFQLPGANANQPA